MMKHLNAVSIVNDYIVQYTFPYSYLVSFSLLMSILIILPFNSTLTAAVSISCDSQQSSSLPIVVVIHLTNDTNNAISYRARSPFDYPAENHFFVDITRDSVTQCRHVINGHTGYVSGSGFTKTIKPGGTINIPLALTLLDYQGRKRSSVFLHNKHWAFPKGKYMFRIGSIGSIEDDIFPAFLSNSTEIEVLESVPGNSSQTKSIDGNFHSAISRLLLRDEQFEALGATIIPDFNKGNHNRCIERIQDLYNSSHAPTGIIMDLNTFFSPRIAELPDSLLICLIRLFCTHNSTASIKSMVDLYYSTEQKWVKKAVLEHIWSTQEMQTATFLIAVLNNDDDDDLVFSAACGIANRMEPDSIDYLINQADLGRRKPEAIYHLYLLTKFTKARDYINHFGTRSPSELFKAIRGHCR